MKRKNYTVFSTYDTYSEENMKIAKESLIENAFFNSDTLTIENNTYNLKKVKQ